MGHAGESARLRCAESEKVEGDALKKIPTIFIRDDTTKKVLNAWNLIEKVHVIREGLATPTRKYDGTCCLGWNV